MKFMSCIEGNLYLGGYGDSQTVDVDLIVNCTPDLPFPADRHNSVHIRIPVKDVDDPKQQVILYDAMVHGNVLQEMHKTLLSGGKVLVHCRMGQQRSAALVVAYLMYSKQFGIHDAIQFVRTKRPEAFLGNNVNFMEALKMFEQCTQKM